MVNITTSINYKTWKLAKDKGIRWSEALEMGIFKLVNEPFGEDRCVSLVNESEIAKKDKVINVLQEKLWEVQDVLEQEREKRYGK